MELRTLNLNENKLDELFRSPECQQLLQMYDGFYTKSGFDLPWVAYLILKENKVVGTCGFTGKPKNGVVEIAYWTFKEFEGQGIASFACNKLVAIAKKEDQNINVTAKTSPKKNASTKILEKNGFVYTKVVQDEEIGDAWFWTLKA